MQDFYTSEILILPKEINSLRFEDQLELKITHIKKILENYLSSKEGFSLSKVSFFNIEYANFPIEEVRRMQAEAEYSPSFSGQEKRVFALLNFDSATTPAQNAALKIIEESPRDTLIILLVGKKEKILETISSRCLTVRLPALETTEEQVNQSANILKDFSWPQTCSQAIDLAQANKDRIKALSLIEELLNEKSLSLAQKQNLLVAYQDLERNQNVLLVLEKCFFSLVDLDQ